jgi:hypothetical protein
VAESSQKLDTVIMHRSQFYNTFRADDNVTYQVMAYRPLNGNELKKKVFGFLNKMKPGQRPKAFDVVIINTAIGQRKN